MRFDKEVLGTIGNCTIIKRNTKFEPFMSAHNYDSKTGTFDCGICFETFQDACVSAFETLQNEKSVVTVMQSFAQFYEAVIVLRKGMTNGDVIKAMFPDLVNSNMDLVDVFNNAKDWWNAPYQKESEE